MSGSYHLRGRYFWILVCLLLVLVVAPEPQQPLQRAEAATFAVTNLNDTGAGSLRQAIIDANNSAGADTIEFSVTGTITLTTGQLTVTDSVTINGPGSPGITLDGNNATRIINIDSSITVMLNDLTFQNGSATPGGAIFHRDGTLTINNSTFSSNSAVSGGVIYNNGTLTINNSTFSGNQVSYSVNPLAAAGGAILNAGPLTITSSTFSGNTATGSAGAIANGSSSMLEITNSTFSGNSATNSGGAIVNGGGSILEITNSTFSGNSTTLNGGAISGGGTLMTITNSTFSGNSTAEGGAIWSSSVTATITSSTFSGNTAPSASGTLHRYSGTINVASSLIVGGSCSGITDLGNNLSFNAAGCPGTTTTDPQLGPLQNNGGPTDTMLPALTGPAVDAYAAPCATATDQRGITRPQGSGCDIGATEQSSLVALAASAVCNGPNLDVTITAGDGPFDITGLGRIQPLLNVNTGTYTLTGPGTWRNLTVTETAGDGESLVLGDFVCRPDAAPPFPPPPNSR